MKKVNTGIMRDFLKPLKIEVTLNSITGSIKLNTFDMECLLLISKNSDKTAYTVDFINTIPKARRKGLATALYKLAHNLLKAQGVRLIHSNSKTTQGSFWADSLDY